MKLKATLGGYSSIVGQSILLQDETGRVVCQLAMLNIGDDGHKQKSEKFGQFVTDKINTTPPAGGGEPGMWSPKLEAIRLLAAEDKRQLQLLELLETIREQIRLSVKPEHRPEGLFKNIQDAVYALRGRLPLMNDAAIMAPLQANSLPASEPVAWRWKHAHHNRPTDPWALSLNDVREALGGDVICEPLYAKPSPADRIREALEKLFKWDDNLQGIIPLEIRAALSSEHAA